MHVPPTHLHAALAGFALSNGVLELNFNGRNKLVGWGKGNETHSVQHSYVQYVEKAGTLFHLNPCDGTNVYTFVPDVGRNTLTPEVGGVFYTDRTLMITSLMRDTESAFQDNMYTMHFIYAL